MKRVTDAQKQLLEDALRSKRTQSDATPLRKRGRRLSHEDIAALIAMYEAGQSTYVIGRHFEINPWTVANHLRREGIWVRPAKGR